MLDYGCVLTPDIFESKTSFSDARNEFSKTIKKYFGDSSFYKSTGNENYVARSYMMAKKMCENSQFTDITDIYACDMDVVSHTYGYDSSNIILLADTQVVQLNDSYGQVCDTDQDGIYDNVEAHTREEVDIKSFLEVYCKYNKYSEEETKDMLSKYGKVDMYSYSSNPVLPDSDFDGRDDLRDGRKLDNEYISINETNNYSNVEINFSQDYRYFFMDSTKYYPELAEMGLVLSNMASKKNVSFSTNLYKTWINRNDGEDRTVKGISEYMNYFGMDNLYEHIVDYNNLEFYDVPYVIGQHDTIALHGKVNNLERNVITLAIGDCGQEKSAFSYLTDLITRNKNNINSKIDFYKKEAENVYQALVDYDNKQTADRWKKSYWIVGYGSGGSIANLVAKKFIDYKHSNQNIYCYTYGATSVVDVNNITDIKDLSNIAYKSIFNIENEDDFILKETDRKLGYYKYGWRVNASVETGTYAYFKWLKDKFRGISNKKYYGSMKDSQDYLNALLIDYNKNNTDAYSKIKNDKKIYSAHSEVSYFVLSSYGEKESIYVSNFLRDRNRDSDGDGLPDIWEKMGADVDDDGIVDVDLPAMGADPHRKDLFVEIDYMKGCKASPSALQRVVDVFDEHDITLHIDAENCFINFPDELNESEELPLKKNIEKAFDDNGSYWKTTIDSHFNKKRKDIFRYCIYVNMFNSAGTLGISNGIPGNSFMCAQGLYGNNEVKEAANFMHELGHTLGLTHGGAKDDHFCYKPNHLSIMNYLYSNKGLYPNDEINYSEYELPEIDINHVDERKGIDPEGIVDDSLGCIWCIYNNGNIKYVKEKSINGKAIDFNRNKIFEKDIKEDLFFYIDTSDGIKRGTKAKATINEWDNLIYKPEENSMVVENKDEDYVLYDGVHGELPVWRYFELEEDHSNEYYVWDNTVYNAKDGKVYYEIELENLGMSSMIADISINSDELKFNLKNLKVELPKHTRDTYSQVKVYIPVKEKLEKNVYDVFIVKKYVDGSEEVKKGHIFVSYDYEDIISEELNQDKVTIKYAIDDYTYEIVQPFGKKYSLPCEAYQKEDGTWTSDAVDNFEKYVDEVVEKPSKDVFVKTQNSDISNSRANSMTFYIIGFILLVCIVFLVRFIIIKIKVKQDENY